MERVLRLSNTDERISYFPDWETIPNSGVGENGSYSLATFTGAEFFFLFRGTGVRFYGRLGGGGGNLLFRLDVNNTNVELNGTNFEDGPTLVWSADNLGDGDHQLYVYVNSLQENGSVAVDYVEIENLSGNGFDLLWAGPNATNVPKEAIVVDNSSPSITLYNPSMWESGVGGQYYGRSLLSTNQAGASLTFYFRGVAIWYYGDTNKIHCFFTISIDDEEPERLDSKNDGGHLTQQMLWSKTNLTTGSHILTLSQDDLGGRWMNLDFFRVLSTSPLPSSARIDTPTTSAVHSGSQPHVVPLAVGLTFCLLTLIGALYLPYRRRIKAALLNARATPPHHPPPHHTPPHHTPPHHTPPHHTPPHHAPPAQGDQLSGVPQESNRPPQLTPPPTHGLLALSSFATTTLASAAPTTSIGLSSSGMPSGYETYDHDESGPDL